MRYGSAGAFRTALERRLLTLAERTDVPLMRLRKLVVFDRLLARLVIVSSEGWILKGAMALHFRVGPQFRTTKDLDLGRHDDEQAATADLRLAQSVELGDYFSFTIQRTAKLDALLEGTAIRYHAIAEVDGRPFEDITVDVGFGDPRALMPDVLRGPDLLRFADILPAEVPALPLEQHVAEKLHAYTRAYASGRASTRVAGCIRCRQRCRPLRPNGAPQTPGWRPSLASTRRCPLDTSRRGRSLIQSSPGALPQTHTGNQPAGRGRGDYGQQPSHRSPFGARPQTILLLDGRAA